MKNLILLLLVSAISGIALGSHMNTGEITYRCLNSLTYEATITTYTNILSPADRPELALQWGDGQSEVIARTDEYDIPNTNMRRNRYVGTHTYASAGTYMLSFEDQNRNSGIKNISNSVNVPFYVSSELIINQTVSSNHSPEFLYPPVDSSCTGQVFISNSGAYDADGDSLAYKLVVCKGENGTDIPDYTFPNASSSFTIDSITGNIIWDTPVVTGEYAVAIKVEEWRNGVLIGFITRDRLIVINSVCNAVENNSKNKEMQVFPNPAHDFVYIKSDISKNIKVEILNASGKTVYSKNCQTNEKININEIVKGVYTIRIIDNHDIYNDKIIIN